MGEFLFSTSITADASGNKAAELRYKAWGETSYTYGTMPTKRQYTGQISEMASIGLYFYNARFYDPALSRFTSADSIIPGAGDVQAWDRYAAMGNNPVIYVDPTGHMQACPDGDLGGGCGSSGNIPDKEKLEIIRKERNTSINNLPSLSSWEQPSWWDLDPQNPDYSVLAVNIGPPGLPGLTLDLILDRFGGIYGGIGVNYGKSLEIFSINLVGGFVGSALDQSIPDQANLQESFLKNLTINVSAGAIGGGGITWSPGASKYIDPIAWEGGGFIPPNLGISAVYNWKIYDLANIYGRNDE